KSAALLVNDSSIGHSPGATTSRSSSLGRRSRIHSSSGPWRALQMSRKQLAAPASLSDWRAALETDRPSCSIQFRYAANLIGQLLTASMDSQQVRKSGFETTNRFPRPAASVV